MTASAGRRAAPPGFLRAKERALAAAIPLNAQLELTYACDCRCLFCYNPPPNGILSAHEWTAILDELRALGTLTLTLTGGEPLAHPEFFVIAEAARARAFALRLFTSGLRVNADTALRIADLRPLSVEMSLHGATATTHDATTRRPGSFDAVWEAVKQLQDLTVPVILKMILTRLNEAELDAAIVRAEGIPLRIDAMLTPCDDGDRRPLDYQASPEAIDRLMAHLARVNGVPHVRRLPGDVNCGLGRLMVTIAPNGDVFPCSQWRSDCLGNARERRLTELWRESTLRERLAGVARAAQERLIERGGSVASFPFCPALALQITGDPLTPDPDTVARADAAARARKRASHSSSLDRAQSRAHTPR